jgi:hypothetical protein
MLRKVTITAVVIAMLALTASVALAKITFHSGPTPTFSGNTATVTWNFSGLGNEDASAQLVLQGFASYTCRNKGQNAAPGQNPVPAQSTSPIVPISEEGKNGRADLSASGTLSAPASVDPVTAGCPNGKNWTANLDSLTVTGATLFIYQPSGSEPANVIYSQFFDNPAN